MNELHSERPGLDRIFELPPDAAGHNAMETYLRLRHPNTAQLLECALEMQHADFPAIHYVAGQAALDIALQRPKDQGTRDRNADLLLAPSMGLRLLAVGIADAQWVKTEAVVHDFQDEKLGLRRRIESLHLVINALQAQAYRKNFEIAASLAAGKPDFFSAEEVADYRRETLELTVDSCEELLGWPASKGEHFKRDIKNGVVTNLVGGAVAQLTDKYLIVPTPLRHTGNAFNRIKFGNLGFTAISLEPPHYPIEIRVTPGPDRQLHAGTELGPAELVVHPGDAFEATIEDLQMGMASGLTTPAMEQLGQAVTEKLDRSYAKRYPHTVGPLSGSP